MINTVFETQLKSLPLINRGKVRDIYAVDEHHLLIVATDRLSAFDVILPTPIPGKGLILNQLSLFWFGFSSKLVANHLTEINVEDVMTDPQELTQVKDRAVVTRRLKPLPIEAIVRGYIAGSGWKDYQTTGQICGHTLPPGLPQAARLEQPLYTPSTKAALGHHDENIDFEKTVALIGEELATQIRDLSLEIYIWAREYALQRGVIIADTKFEFGIDEQGKLYLIDEVLTPDSSRFWPVNHYQTGISPPSFDKQYIRDYLESLAWNKKPPAPELPSEVVQKTAEKYQEAAMILNLNL